MPQGVSIWSDFSETSVPAEAFRQLVAMGFNVKQSTFYRHCDKGRCRKNTNGLYTARMMKQYIEAEGYIRPGDDTEDENDNISSLTVRKLEGENEKLYWSNKQAKLKYEKEMGKLIEREGLNLEMAARTVAFATGYRQKVSMESPKLITAMNGDITRQPEFEDLLLGIFDELLNEFCSIEEFSVLFDDLAELVAEEESMEEVAE